LRLGVGALIEIDDLLNFFRVVRDVLALHVLLRSARGVYGMVQGRVIIFRLQHKIIVRSSACCQKMRLSMLRDKLLIDGLIALIEIDRLMTCQFTEADVLLILQILLGAELLLIILLQFGLFYVLGVVVLGLGQGHHPNCDDEDH
jgi:hypothetical protein